MTWLVVHNKAAGRADVTARLEEALARHRITHRTVAPGSVEDTVAAIRAAADEGFTRFASVGGDGTLHLVVNALMEREWAQPPTVAVVPAGSGSDFIRTFALPRTLEEGVARLAAHDLYRCDVGRMEGAFGTRWFVNAVDIGIAAAAVVVGRRLPRFLGGVRYRSGFWIALPWFRAGQVTVETERRTIAARGINVVIANGQFFGGGLNVAPQAALGDGLLDVEVFACTRRYAFSVMPRVVRGLHLRHPAIKVTRGSRIAVTVPDGWPIEADGELVGTGRLTIEVVPGAIDVAI